ncbi:NADPH-dependent F420 reductase [Georgenia subflava]|uniref:NADP oxidoreductase n=1 Tax=Georgenia subflava TaxID=1622177 RepID=A0A6N7EUG1_9MICO|nr:NAD(P)-binding domain-containing protein [Georgenia subflava]MPV38784.1 NADP oxidoreductase [Georgenia subflava]
MSTIGILGAGRVGTAIARQALRAGYDVVVATAADPAEISLIVEVMAPGARAVTAAEAAAADLVVIAVPMRKYDTLDPELLASRVVVDVMNHWAETDGDVPDLDGASSTSEAVQAHLAGARVVKTLNHIGYHELESDHVPAGAPGRRALAVAGDDDDARAVVADLIERLGFDAVDAGPLAAGRALEPGTEIFAGRHDRAELTRLLEHACLAAVQR